MTRRPDGALERDIMVTLWAADRPLQPGEIRDQLETRLAYTSVATVVGRLYAKGLVRRHEAGRAFAYEACVDEAELAARRIGDVLAASSDKGLALAGFVGSLSKKDLMSLRRLLAERHG